MNTNKTILLIGIAASLGVLGLFASTGATLSTAPSLAQISFSSVDLWNHSELYFGSNKPDGSSVSEKQFRQFADAQVTPPCVGV